MQTPKSKNYLGGVSIFYDIVEKNIKVAIDTLYLLTDNTKFEEMHIDISIVIINAVHSISDYYERLDKYKISINDDLWLKSYVYLNNQIKHDEKLQILYFPVCGSMYPMGYPMRYGMPGVSWNNFDDNGRKEARAKREHYEECLCNKDIEDTLKIILKIIKNIEYTKQKNIK